MSVHRPRAGCLALLCLFTAAYGTGRPADEKSDKDDVAAVRKPAEKAEVHVVSVQNAATNSLWRNHITSWPELVAGLRERKPASAYVLRRLSKDAKTIVAEDGIVDKVATPREHLSTDDGSKVGYLTGFLVLDLNHVIDSQDFYNEKAFKDVVLDDYLQHLVLLGPKRTMRQNSFLNWGLLNAAFPKAIAPPLSSQFRVVRVQVREAADVVLVLSCSTQCLWEVDVKPGGKVVGIVLCGSGAQEVEVFENPVKAPVLYRAYYGTDGASRVGKGDYFTAPKKSDDEWPKFVAKVKETTGKDMSSFQRVEKPGPKDEPFVVPPKAK